MLNRRYFRHCLSKIGLLALLSSSPSSAEQGCLDVLVKLEAFNSDFVLANGVAITGEMVYPLEMVLHDLKITDKTIGELQDKKVLSIAEGFSGLLPFLLNREIEAKALDLWYGAETIPDNLSGQKMKEYIQRFGQNLIQGDARNIPAEDETYDVIYSHLLVNNVALRDQLEILDDVVRVLEKGGHARIFGFDQDKLQTVIDSLNLFWRKKILFSVENRDYEFTFRDRTISHQSLLLDIRKLQENEGIPSREKIEVLEGILTNLEDGAGTTVFGFDEGDIEIITDHLDLFWGNKIQFSFEQQKEVITFRDTAVPHQTLGLMVYKLK